MKWNRTMRGLFLLILASVFSKASADPLFETDVYPILKRHCSGCHFPEAERLKSGLDLSTAAYAIEGGDEGVAIVPGDVASSKIIGMLEWTREPHMPPEDKGQQLSAEEIDVIRQWIAAGALSNPELAPAPRDESAPLTAAELARAPIAAIAYSPDGRWLAEGTLGVVRVYHADAADATPIAELSGHTDMVRALAFTRDGEHLAAGAGAPGRSGEVRVWRTSDWSLVRTFDGHRDIVLDLAISPDGTRLATSSYDKTVRLWNRETGETLHTFKDHVDAVYAVAFSPDGTLLASGAGDRTIKLWNVETGAMALTISDSLAAVHALAFAPSTGHLAGAGADKIIRVWDVSNLASSFTQTDHSPGTLIVSSFAHDAPVLDLAYAPDGARLFSTAEDRQIKAWNAADLTELFAFEPQSDWVTGLAVSPDGERIAAARYDATRTIYRAETGEHYDGRVEVAAKPAERITKVTGLDVDAVIIEATVPPSFASVSPDRWPRGSEVDVTIAGKNLEDAVPILSHPSITAEILEVTALDPPDLRLAAGPRGTGADILDNARPYRIKLKLAIGEDAPIGRHEILLRTPIGMSNGRSFEVTLAPDIPEAEPNDRVEDAMPLEWPAVIAGRIAQAGDADRYRIALEAGDEIVAALTDFGLNPLLKLWDTNGAVVATNDDYGSQHRSRLGYRADVAGEFILEVGDRDMDRASNYRLHVGAFPFVTAVWPPGIQSSNPQRVQVAGFNLGATEFEVDPPDTVTHDTTVPLPIASVPGSPVPIARVAVAKRLEALEQEPNDDTTHALKLKAPFTVNGTIARESDRDYYKFLASAGETLLIETNAARLGSELDSFIEVLDADGSRLQRGVIRSVAETIITLNNRDSRSAGIRLESWRDFAMGDYVMIGAEIIQVDALPDYGDEDVAFTAYPNGQRKGFFGTTPEHHAVDTKVYKVEIHPPDAEFAPNGMPAHPLYWQNDDGFFGDGDASGDSLLEFTAPYTGEFIVAVSDAARNGGERYPYRLAVRYPTPDYTVDRSPFRVNISRNSRVPIDVRVRRVDGFDAAVRVWIEGLPEGFSVEPDVVLPGEDRVKLALVADATAQSTPIDARFTIKAESMLNGETVVRETALGPITIIEVKPDLVVNNSVQTVDIAQGKSAWLPVTLDRNNGFNARVPIDVLNLPYGVRVLDTGLNGILVREGEHERSMEIYAEPWVQPMMRTIYVQARIETPSAANPVFIGQPIELRIGEERTEVAKDE